MGFPRILRVLGAHSIYQVYRQSSLPRILRFSGIFSVFGAHPPRRETSSPELATSLMTHPWPAPLEVSSARKIRLGLVPCCLGGAGRARVKSQPFRNLKWAEIDMKKNRGIYMISMFQADGGDVPELLYVSTAAARTAAWYPHNSAWCIGHILLGWICTVKILRNRP